MDRVYSLRVGSRLQNFNFVLRKFIPEERARYQCIHKTSMLGHRLSVYLNDKLLARQMKGRPGVFHGTPHQFHPPSIETSSAKVPHGLT